MYFNPKKADSIYNFLSHVYICSSCLHQSFTNDCCVVHNEPRDMECISCPKLSTSASDGHSVCCKIYTRN